MKTTYSICDKYKSTKNSSLGLLGKWKYNGMLDKVIFTDCKPKSEQLKTWYIAKVQNRITTITDDADTTHKLHKLIDDINSWSAATFNRLKESNEAQSEARQKAQMYGRVGSAAVKNIMSYQFNLGYKCQEVVLECWNAVAALDYKIRNELQLNDISAGPNDFPTELKFDVPDMKQQLQQALEGIDFKPDNRPLIQTETVRIFSETIKPICQKIEEDLKETRKTMDANVATSCRRAGQEIPNKLLNSEFTTTNVECMQEFIKERKTVEASVSSCTRSDDNSMFLDSFSTTVECIARQLQSTADAMKSMINQKLGTFNEAVQRIEYEIMHCIRN